MFEQSFVGVSTRSGRGLPVMASLMLQFSVVGVAVVIPLLNPEMLPRAVWAALPLASPPPAARPPAAEPVVREFVKSVTRAVSDAVWIPRGMPPKAVVIDDGELTQAAQGPSDGVPYGVPMPEGVGRPDGVMARLLDAVKPVAEAKPREAAVAKPKEPIRVRTGGNVQDALIIHRVIPVYPLLARNARVEGKVVFKAVISAQGTIQALTLVSGHALLVDAAREAVKQWRYRPTMLNGDPCEVDTVIEVNFTLNR